MAIRWTIGIALVLASQLRVPALDSRALAQCQRSKLTDATGASENLFGWHVATDGGTVLVGVPFDDDEGSNSGSVFVYELAPDGPVLAEQILRPNAAVGDAFGWCVSVQGPIAMVGVAGEVQLDVFELLPGAAPVRRAVLIPWDQDWENFFPESVALSGDVLVVGAPRGTSLAIGGSAYVFERDADGIWQPSQKLLASDAQLGDAFGERVAVDADVIVVGAPEDDDLGFATGSAYIFERDPAGTDWLEVQKLYPIVHTGMDIFGDAVSVSGDGILVGASQTNYAGIWTGVAYVFRRTVQESGVVSWELEHALRPNEPLDGEAFGQSVSIDGDRALVGAWYSYQQGPQSGAAYVFERDPNTGVWTQTAKLVPLDGQAYDEFGYSVALSGTTAVVGAWKDDDMGTDSGSAYIFDLAGGDCNGNGWCDDVDISDGTSQDANANGVPDECDCWGDLDASGSVDLADLSALLTNFGLPSGMQYFDGDLDADADVDLADLSALLERYGVVCP